MITDNFKNIITILRKADSVQFIGKKCSLIIETNWISIYIILEFILNYKDEVMNLLLFEEYQVDKVELEHLFNLVFLLRHFIEKMESNHSICYVGKYINDMVVYLHGIF